MTKDSTRPFDMYQAMRSQPDAITRTLQGAEAAAGEAVDRVRAASRVLLVGIGTSYHAALVGQRLLRDAGCDAWAVHSFDFALTGPRLNPTDAIIAVSHRGTKQYTNQSLQRARRAGAYTVLISGEGGAPDGAADHIWRTVAQERSSAHTVSYTTAIAALAHLATGVARANGAQMTAEEQFLTGPLTGAVDAALGREDQMRDLARQHAGHRRIWVSGGGVDAITAVETALKIKETSYLQAEGQQVEAFIHGPFCTVEREDLFILLALDTPARPRVTELSSLVGALGAPLIVVDDGTGDPISPASTQRVTVAPAPGALAAITGIVPLQLFAYHLALQVGTNPDSFRSDDPGFPRIQQLLHL